MKQLSEATRLSGNQRKARHKRRRLNGRALHSRLHSALYLFSLFNMGEQLSFPYFATYFATYFDLIYIDTNYFLFDLLISKVEYCFSYCLFRRGLKFSEDGCRLCVRINLTLILTL